MKNPKFSSRDEALGYIYSTTWMGTRLGLDRIRELCEMLGNPQKALKFVHIAGTNGKGSTAAMLASVLQEAGYKTGLYTSPVISDFAERMSINGVQISDSDICEHMSAIRDANARQADPTTVFETITALAFLYFHAHKCDIVVLEVGMGGRLDATNVIDPPEVAMITSIGLDHTEALGDTVEKIAREKAGIIKRGTEVVCHPQVPSVAMVIEEACEKAGVGFTCVDEREITDVSSNVDGQTFKYHGLEFSISLLGDFQIVNACAVLATVRALVWHEWEIRRSDVLAGLKKATWPGRFELLQRDPPFILDGAHNPAGVESCTRNLAILFPDKEPVFIFGVLEDKDCVSMSNIIASRAARIYTVTPPDSRALPAKRLAVIIPHPDVFPMASIKEACEHALATSTSDTVICALGSLATIAEVRGFFDKYSRSA